MRRLILSPDEAHRELHNLESLKAYCTPNFLWKELLIHQTEEPTAYVMGNLYEIACRVQAVRDLIVGGSPIIITSGWRSKAYNARISKYPKSLHIEGKALDFIVVGKSSTDVRRLLYHLWGGGMELNTPHVHLDIGNRRRFEP